MFKADNPVIVFLNKLTDIVILNLFFIILCIPVVTIGAATTALYYVCVKMVKNEESYIWKDFFKSFAQNFKQATIIWLINLVAIGIFVTDIAILSGGALANVSRALFIAILIVGLILVSIMLYVYPMQSHFYNSVPNTIKNAFILSIGNLPYTVLFIIISALPFLVLLSPYAGYLTPVVILVGFSGPVYICSHFWTKIFAKLDPEEEDRGDSDGQEEEQKSE